MMQLDRRRERYALALLLFWGAIVQASAGGLRQQTHRHQHQGDRNEREPTEANDAGGPSSRRKLIIGGTEVEQFRYPYMVSLAEGLVHKCGGSLIAPDIVLTAAHCARSFGEVRIGRHNLSHSHEEEQYESFVVEEIVTHPNYYFDKKLDVDPYDVALVRLYGQSAFPPVRINRNQTLLSTDESAKTTDQDAPSNPSTPRQIKSPVKPASISTVDTVSSDSSSNGHGTVTGSMSGTPLQVIGWGAIDPDDLSIRSDVLLETTVHYIPNPVCKNTTGTFHGVPRPLAHKVLDVTLCAMNFDTMTDSCRGDSGGPLLHTKGEHDVQVGVVSYGYGCANPTLPAFYARVSHVASWIDDFVCRYSIDPPADFNCHKEKETVPCSGISPQSFDQSTAGTGCLDEDIAPVDLVSIRIDLNLDDKPSERGWILQRDLGDGRKQTIAGRPIFSFANEQPGSTVSETIHVPNNQEYSIVIMDSFGDGDSRWDAEDLFSLTSVSSNDPVSAVPLSQNPQFHHFKTFQFVVGTIPTLAPTISPAPTASFAPTASPTEERLYLTVVINFDSRPQDAGFDVKSLAADGVTALETIHVSYPGTYKAKRSVAEKVYLLPPGDADQLYRFTMTANEGKGFAPPGNFQVWLGPESAGKLLFEGGRFYYEDVHIFQVPANYVVPDYVFTDDSTDEHVGPAFEASSSASQLSSWRLAILAVSFIPSLLLSMAFL